MSKALKTFSAVAVILAFFVTAIICCCVVKEAMASAQKASCGHCSTKGDPTSHECCFSKASPMEVAKLSMAGLIGVLPLVAFTILTFFYFKPTPQLAYSRYQNGPPGYVSSVPLYISQRNIRL